MGTIQSQQKTVQRQRFFGRAIAATLSVVLVLSGIIASSHGDSAVAANNASVVLDKDVNGVKSVSGVLPGEELTYTVDFAANDNDADGPVTITDRLPEAFAGWEITGLSASFQGLTDGITVNLPGVTSGSPAPVNGTLSTDPTDLVITVGVALPVFAGIGNTAGTGLPADGQGRLRYTILVPTTLTTDDPILRTNLVNTATITAKAGTRDISARDSATAQVDNPVQPQVEVTKTWVPEAANFDPESESRITIGATQTSNVSVEKLAVQDPADPALAPEGATQLPAGNPFNFVDFAGFDTPADPTATVPAGVESVEASVYWFNGTVWGWVPWSDQLDNADIAGVRITHESPALTIRQNATINQSFNVAQRETNRATNAILDEGWSVDNTVLATVVAQDDKTVTQVASANFSVLATQVDVEVDKKMYLLGSDPVVETNDVRVSAGDPVGIVVRAVNRALPYSTTIERLSIVEPDRSEPDSGAVSEEYFGENIAFGAFDNSNLGAVWPSGATGATLTWQTTTGPEVVQITAGAPLPAAPNGVVGFELEFTGAIAPGATSEVRYTVDTNSAANEATPAIIGSKLLNRVGLSGSVSDLVSEQSRSQASMTLINPTVNVNIAKKAGPKTVTPGQLVRVQLDGNLASSGSQIQVNNLVIEDSRAEASAALPAGTSLFWDAFELKRILPPISVPLTGTNPGMPASLTIRYADAAGDWQVLAQSTPGSPINPNAAIPVPAGATGVRFDYSNTVGFSQATLVKPNLEFEALSQLRAPLSGPTAELFDTPVPYTNYATINADAVIDGRDIPVVETNSKLDISIRGENDSTGVPAVPVGHAFWASKAWSKTVLTAQSDETVFSSQQWAAVKPGFEEVTLLDSTGTNETGGDTVFETLNLTSIAPIRSGGSLANSALDPQLIWDKVSQVELFLSTQDPADGTVSGAWQVIPAPATGWMTTVGGNTRFVGYTLTPAQQESATGVRLTMVENPDTRAAAAAQGDLTAPSVGSGVSSSADIRSYRLDWVLRDATRFSGSSLTAEPLVPPTWVTAKVGYNCLPSESNTPILGCISNTHQVSGISSTDTSPPAMGSARLQLSDDVPNVGISKSARALDPVTGNPTGATVTSGGKLALIVPNPADGVPQADYPKARFTVSGSNNSRAPQLSGENPDAPVVNAAGAARQKLGKIRLTDSVPADTEVPLPARDIFGGRDFIAEAAAGDNPFNMVTLLGVNFGTLPSYIKPEQSFVDLMLFDGTTTSVVEDLTMEQILNNDPVFTALLPQIVGISATYSSDNPLMLGNSIPVGVPLSMNLDVQLREFERADSSKRVTGGPTQNAEEVLVGNTAAVGGWDVVLDPTLEDPRFQPGALDKVSLDLRNGKIDVLATKSTSVSHGTARNQVIYEAHPDNPVNVALNAESNESTAPISALVLEDQTPGFWERFQLNSIGDVLLPNGADTALVEVKVGSNWVSYEDYTGELSEIVGVKVTFTRAEGNQTFPGGAAAWSTSWGAASIPFVVSLRDGAEVTWGDDSQDNTVVATVTHPDLDTVTSEATSTLLFEIGTHRLEVQKIAPNAGSANHDIDPLTYRTWQLSFKNIGNSLLPIESVTDQLPDTLTWNGEPPTFESLAGDRGMQGLTADGTEISVEYSEESRELTFSWPDGQRMYPNETMTIRILLELTPLPVAEKSINSVVVQTKVDLASCAQPTTQGQMPLVDDAPNQCSNRNFVTTEIGNHASTSKAVKGESTETLGEDLVQGAIDTRTMAECTLPQLPFFEDDFVRAPCASLTTLGGTDTWSLQNANKGSDPISRMVIVDMLPRFGDRFLGGADRDSTFRPVLAGTNVEDVFRFAGLPEGARVAIDVTTNPQACIGADPVSSLWSSDPTCEDQTTNPANVWVASADYTGSLEDIAGVRFDITMDDERYLGPAERIGIEFDTVNVAGDGTDEKLSASLERFGTPQGVWNQSGIVAWDAADVRTLLPLAPRAAGVMVATGDLVISKAISPENAEFAPTEFVVDLSCTVPSGDADTERIALDLGDFAQITIPANGSVTVPNLPIGANCVAAERGEVGEFGETGRSIESTPGVTPARDGLSADIAIRSQESTELNFVNTYTTAGLTVEKAVLSTNNYAVTAEQRDGSYLFELVCTVPATGESLEREFSVTGGEQHTVTDLPDGAQCSLTETDSGGADWTSITMQGSETAGVTVEEFVIVEGGVFALVANEFVGVPPLEATTDGSLENTGGQSPVAMYAIVGLLLLGAATTVFAVVRRNQKRRMAE